MRSTPSSSRRASATNESSIRWHVRSSSTVDRSLVTFGVSDFRANQSVSAELSGSSNSSFTRADAVSGRNWVSPSNFLDQTSPGLSENARGTRIVRGSRSEFDGGTGEGFARHRSSTQGRRRITRRPSQRGQTLIAGNVRLLTVRRSRWNTAHWLVWSPK